MWERKGTGWGAASRKDGIQGEFPRLYFHGVTLFGNGVEQFAITGKSGTILQTTANKTGARSTEMLTQISIKIVHSANAPRDDLNFS